MLNLDLFLEGLDWELRVPFTEVFCSVVSEFWNSVPVNTKISKLVFELTVQEGVKYIVM